MGSADTRNGGGNFGSAVRYGGHRQANRRYCAGAARVIQEKGKLMEDASIWVLGGLILDIIGFVIIGRNLFKRGEKRPMWSTATNLDRLGMMLVILGFACQAVGQVWPLAVGQVWPLISN